MRAYSQHWEKFPIHWSQSQSHIHSLILQMFQQFWIFTMCSNDSCTNTTISFRQVCCITKNISPELSKIIPFKNWNMYLIFNFWMKSSVIVYPKYTKGAIIFYREGGGRLSVMAGRQFFLVPPFAYDKKFWSPPLPTAKNFGPPLWPHEKILVPPPPRWKNIPLA